MDYIELDRDFLKEMKKACDASQLKIFNSIFKDYIEDLELLTSYSAICKKMKRKELSISDFSFLPTKKQQEKLFAIHQIQTIEEYFNAGWVPDWNNANQPKYYPYFEKRKTGWVFDTSGYDSYGSHGLVGFYATREISDHVGKNFIHLYKIVTE